MAKFLSEAGLRVLWQNIKTLLNKSISTLETSVSNLQVDLAAVFNQKGNAGGLAELDESGKVPSSQLPSYVDDVLEYASTTAFPASGEAGKIYVATDTNKTYRWSGTAYVEIAAGLALGETSATAYRGDRGKIAYDHSQTAHAPTTAATTTADGLMSATDKAALDAHTSDIATLKTGVSTNTSDIATLKTSAAAALALGETSATAYRGDRGKIAYDHSQTAHAPTTAATTTAAGLMSAADKTALDAIQADNLPALEAAIEAAGSTLLVSGGINITQDVVVSLLGIANALPDNTFRLYMITDSAGNLPPAATEAYVTAHANVAGYIFGTSAIGANVGDLLLVGRLNGETLIKKLGIFNAKAPNEEEGFPGAEGMLSPTALKNLDANTEAVAALKTSVSANTSDIAAHAAHLCDLSTAPVVVGAVRTHTGETTEQFRRGCNYVGMAATDPVAYVEDQDGVDYYSEYVTVDAVKFAAAVNNLSGNYRFYTDYGTSSGNWLMGNGSKVNMEDFGLAGYNITYKSGGFKVIFTAGKDERWEDAYAHLSAAES